MEKPRDMDLTRMAQDVRATLSMARSLRKMNRPNDAKDKIKQADDELKKIIKQQGDFMKSTPNHPRLPANAKSIKEAQDDYNLCSQGK